MPQPDLHFNGQTYAAFSDLCGFKEMMKDRKGAYEALNYLFNSTYDLLHGNNNVKALAVSDCVISWATDRELENIIEFTSQLHKKMIERRYLIRTTIAFGEFQYQDRIRLTNLGKEMIIGGAYLTAVIENDRTRPGQIILVGDNRGLDVSPNAQMWKQSKKPKGWEYFWSATTQEEISRIIEERKKAYKAKYERLKDIYQGMLS